VVGRDYILIRKTIYQTGCSLNDKSPGTAGTGWKSVTGSESDITGLSGTAATAGRRIGRRGGRGRGGEAIRGGGGRVEGIEEVGGGDMVEVGDEGLRELGMVCLGGNRF